MNKCQLLLVLIIGIHVGIRLPAAKKGAEQFKNSVGSKVVEYAAVVVSQQINAAIFPGHTTHSEEK